MTNQIFQDALYAIYLSIREMKKAKLTRIKRSSYDHMWVNYYAAIKRAYDQSRELKDYPGNDIKKGDINKNLMGLWESHTGS